MEGSEDVYTDGKVKGCADGQIDERGNRRTRMSGGYAANGQIQLV